MMNRIEKLRKRVDRVDNRIFKLLVKRYGLVSKIGEQKRQNKLSVIDRDRETNILRRFRILVEDDFLYRYIEKIYRAVFESSYEAEISKDE